LSKLRVSFEYLFAGPSIQVFGNQNMVILLKRGAEARPGPTVLCSRRAGLLLCRRRRRVLLRQSEERSLVFGPLQLRLSQSEERLLVVSSNGQAFQQNALSWHQNTGGLIWWIWGECDLKWWIWGEFDLGWVWQHTVVMYVTWFDRLMNGSVWPCNAVIILNCAAGADAIFMTCMQTYRVKSTIIFLFDIDLASAVAVTSYTGVYDGDLMALSFTNQSNHHSTSWV